LGELEASVDLPIDEDAPWVARNAVLSLLADWGFGDEDTLDNAALVVSELVSNAVRHGGGCLELVVSLRGQLLTMYAADGSAVVPRRREPHDSGGRGIAIIEALTRAWGVQDDRNGKRVWVIMSVV
jgi:anti-sigma regulatory factor (Ser/Thr protein kinase)